jgi:hypothetical protein
MTISFERRNYSGFYEKKKGKQDKKREEKNGKNG